MDQNFPARCIAIEFEKKHFLQSEAFNYFSQEKE